MNGGDRSRAVSFIVARTGICDLDILHYCTGIEEWLLKHDTDIPAQMMTLDIVYVNTVDKDFSLTAGIEPLKELYKTGFAGTGRTEYSHRFTLVRCE